MAVAANTSQQLEKQRTLLCVTGLSPQIITETLYALLQRDGANAIPDRIVVMTTARGEELISNDLIDSAGPCHLQCLLDDYGFQPAPSLLRAPDIHVISNAEGKPLNDIRTREHNEAAADLVCKLVRELTEVPANHLHASIAGGRKTMGFYLGHAMSLFARPKDEISHVLVNPPFEGHPEFYFPPRKPVMIRVRENGRSRLIRTDRATITLASIPIVRLRQNLPPELMDRAVSYSEAVELAQRSLAPPRLVIDIQSDRVSCSGHIIRLPGAQLALLAWMADRIRRGLGGVKRADMDDHRAEILRWRAYVTGEHSGSTEAFEKAEFNQESFDSTNSRLRSALARQLGHELAQRYQIRLQDGKRNQPMTLHLMPEHIEFGGIESKEGTCS
ncbi:MAG: CRISPR-associated ring nuclease Csm6 [Wenzhouxiangellaceae bacterium]|nr:CRISPR-associated ring nuclease Csm6 [Wenzhouxiangellaceae bacterium]